ncbi:MAG: thiamine pyrophosphate-binding protein [Verrucomicrobiales bacterium]
MNSWDVAMDVVNGCLRAGVREFVVCGGARNAVLLEVLARAEEAGKVRLWRHFEERGAGFFALGRMMETGEPCAVVTTSGTAVAELLPAVVEAFYQARPLVALTADRPGESRGRGVPQGIEQVEIFKGYAAWGFDGWSGRMPVHVNVELGEDFEPAEAVFAELGEFVAELEKLNVAGLARWLREDIYQGVVVMVGGLEPGEREDVFHFCCDFGAPVVADATSGLREALQGLAVHDADRVLKERPPGKVLRLGEVPTGRFWRDLEALERVSVWSVCRNGLPGLARETGVVCGDVGRVLRGLGGVEPADDALDHLVDASKRAARIDEMLECYPDSEPALVRTISQFACLANSVYLGNSMPVREWNSFAQWAHPVAEVRANRGANGIDGQVSSWLGWTAEQEDAWAVLGDLTVLYDAAAPAMLQQVECAGRVLVVINNRGGRIFERLPRLEQMSGRAVECLTQPHGADLEGLAKLWGMEYLRVRTADDLDAFEPGEVAMLMEVVPDEGQTAGFWRERR